MVKSKHRRIFLLNRTLLATVLIIFLSGFLSPAFSQSNVWYDVTSFGANGSDKKLDTDSINAAILSVADKGGGTIYFPPGTYLSTSIHLKSSITLYLEAGAVIEAVSDTVANYDNPEPNESGGHYQDYGHSHWKNSLIWGIGLHDISIIGPGMIYGKGLNPGFNRFADESKGDKRYQDGGPGSGNKAIALRDCHNVILRDFSILHGGHFGDPCYRR